MCRASGPVISGGGGGNLFEGPNQQAPRSTFSQLRVLRMNE